MFVADLHARLSTTFMFFALAMGLWGLFAYVRKQPVGSNYWGALVIGETLGVVQGVLGLVRLVDGGGPERIIHILYGVVAVITWPAAFGYTRGRDSKAEAFTYGLVGLFLFGIALRASTTG